jgi:heterodisulfide reductase subunit C
MPHIYLYRYMELLSGGYSLTEAKKQLEEKIENAAGGSEVKNEYNKIISEIYDSLSDEEKLSGLLGIPECKSCSNCGYSSVCNTPRLKGLMENLQRRAAAYNVNQEDIGSYLCS